MFEGRVCRCACHKSEELLRVNARVMKCHPLLYTQTIIYQSLVLCFLKYYVWYSWLVLTANYKVKWSYLSLGYITRDSTRSVAISSWLLPLLLYFGGAEGNRHQQEVSYIYNYILLCFVSTVIWENFITISTSLAASPSSLVPRPPCPALASFPGLVPRPPCPALVSFPGLHAQL